MSKISNDKLAAQFTNYIQKAVVSAKIDYLRHKTVISSHEEITDQIPETPAALDSCGQILDEIELVTIQTLEQVASSEQLYFALQKLTLDQKAVLFHSIIEERDTKETAMLLRKSIRRIQQIKKAILDDLYRELKKGEIKNG